MTGLARDAATVAALQNEWNGNTVSANDSQIDVSPAEKTLNDRRRSIHSTKVFIRDTVIILVAAVAISVGIKAYIVRTFYIPSESMQATLQVNDHIVVNELAPRIFKISHGDIVVFRDPGGWLPSDKTPNPQGVAGVVDWALTSVGLSSSDSDNHLVKRVIGLPGDKVVCCNSFGQMTVNGIPLIEPYVKLPSGVTSVSADAFSVVVPPRSFWVMGDNRYDSKDSRYNRLTPSKGFVPEADVVGKAFVVSWPSQHWSLLDDYPRVFEGVDAAATK